MWVTPLYFFQSIELQSLAMEENDLGANEICLSAAKVHEDHHQSASIKRKGLET